MKQSKGTFTSVCLIPWTFVVKKVLLIGSTSYSITLSFQKYLGSWHVNALDARLQCLPWAVMCKNGSVERLFVEIMAEEWNCHVFVL
jgi:hypothetical protein